VKIEAGKPASIRSVEVSSAALWKRRKKVEPRFSMKARRAAHV
jgi:hypothetical protein